MGIVFNNASIDIGSRIAFVRIADDIFFSVLFGTSCPFDAGWETAAAAAS